MKKKTLWTIVLIVIILNFIFVGVVHSSGDDPNVRIVGDKTSLQTGDELEISIYGENICGISFTMSFDSDKLELLTPIEVSSNWSKSEIETTYFFNTSNYEAVENEIVCKYKFRVLADAPAGSTTVVFENIQVTAGDASTVTISNKSVMATIIRTDFYVNVGYSTTAPTNGNVLVTLTSNKEVQNVDGWTKSADNMVLTKTYTQNVNESVTVKDTNENEYVANIQITNIDRTNPTVNVGYSNSQLTNENVVVTISANEKIQSVSGWIKLTGDKILTKSYEQNTEEAITVKDLAGNETIANIQITNIDKTSPTISVNYSTTEVTNADIVVTISANEKIQNVIGWTKSTDEKILTKTYSENTEESITIKDLAGNEVVANIDISNIDRTIDVDGTPPSVTVSNDPVELTNTNVVVTISADEKIQDVTGWTKSTDETELTKSYTQNAEETVIIKDLAGNETTANVSVTNIDKTKPTLDIEYSTVQLTNKDVVVTITSNEEVQDITGWTKSLSGVVLSKTYTYNTDESITVKDLAGNESTAEISITNIDKEKPVLNISYSTTEPTRGNVVVTINSNKEVDDVSGWTKSTDGKKLTKTYYSNIQESVSVTDMVGNESIAEINITNIDKVSPSLSTSYSTTSPTAGSVVVTITANEEVQEVSGWLKSSNGKSLTKSYPKNKEESVTVKDLAGNESVAYVKVKNIGVVVPRDENAPTVLLSYSTEELTNEDVVVTITADEKIQSVRGWTRSSDEKVLTKSYSENTEETLRVKDLSGNEVAVNISITNIDKTKPILNIECSDENLTNEDVVVTITSNEEIQDIPGWEKSNEGKRLEKTYTQNTQETVSIKDLAGNEMFADINITNIDKEGPVANVEYSTKEPTGKNVVVTITLNEKVQDVPGWNKSSDGKTITKSYSQNAQETVTLKDLAGNETDLEIKVNNIDIESPELLVNYSTKNMTKDGVIVTIVSDEELQELDGWALSQDRKCLVKMYTQNISEVVDVMDVAGNHDSVKIVINNIDKITPEVAVHYSTQEQTYNNVVVTLVSNEEIQEIDGWQLSENKKELVKEYNKNDEETVIIKDLVGNEIEVYVKVSNIISANNENDTTNPELSVIYDKSELKDKNKIIVFILANENIQEVDGWILSSDRKSLRKEYSNNVNEYVVVKDLAGNSTRAEISISDIVNNNSNENRIDNSINNTIDNSVDNTTNNTIDNRVDNSVNNTVDNSINNTIDNSANQNTVNNTIDNKTNTSNEINNNNKNQNNTQYENSSTKTDVDNTYSPDTLPYTGHKILKMLSILSIITIFTMIVFKHYKKYSDKEI